MVKTITITDEAYEKLKNIKENLKLSFSDTILYLTKKNKTNWEKIVKYFKEGIEIDEKIIEEMRRTWKKRVLS